MVTIDPLKLPAKTALLLVDEKDMGTAKREYKGKNDLLQGRGEGVHKKTAPRDAGLKSNSLCGLAG
ncbi:hypothetical protein L2725_00280 [Shewanella corallii]|uniref:Uncharacterized protein n=1 Tax=Shewanella corallii TaxID=560080 RepID=A0ABT0N1C0_9GAMM|nr:hypothetical protein [Shewanella corallii]MCL2912228.1 hypothetical protein [Shewanella corallii]